MAQTPKRRRVDEDENGAVAVAEEPVESSLAPDPPAEPETSEEKRNKMLLPVPPGRRLSKDQLFAYLAALDPDTDWPHCNVYVWRRYPIIDRTLIDPLAKKYIQLIRNQQDGITEDEFVWRHGSGEYRIGINDLNKPKGQSICECVFSINDPEKPPVLDKAELVLGHPSNRSYIENLRARGELPPEGKPMAPAQGTDSALLVGLIQQLLRDRENKKPNGDTSEEKATSKMLDMLSEANKKSIDMVISQSKGQEPAAMVQLISSIKDLMPKPAEPKSDDKEIFKMILEQQKANMDLVLKMMEANNNKKSGDSLLDNLEKLVKVKELFGGESGGSDNGLRGWKALVPEVAPYVPETLKQVGNIFANIGMLGMRRAPAATPTTHLAPNPPAAIPENPAPGDAMNGAAETPKPEENPMLQQAIAQLAGPLLNHLNTGSSGLDFADWFIGGYGQLAYRTVSGLGKEKIILTVKGIPELWQQIQPMEAQFNEFVEEFCNWEPPDDEDEDDPPPVDPPVGEQRRKRRGPEVVK